MSKAIILLIVGLALASPVRAGERRHAGELLRLTTPALLDLVTLPSATGSRALADVSIPEDVDEGVIGIPPFITLFTPPAPTRGARGDTTTPLLAFGARVQGRTLVAFTRPGAKTDPDERVVYQRLVASDLFQGRRFSVTVYEDHALGPSASQILGVGARLMLRPTVEIRGWRMRVEVFASYDLTQGATGYVALVGRPPSLLPSVGTP